MVTAVVSLLFLKRWLLKSLAMGAAAGEVYFAAVEAVLVFHIAVFAERRVLLISAAVIESTVPIAVKVAAILAKAVAILVSPVLATFSITFKTVSATFTKATFAILAEPARVLLLLKRFTTFIKATTFVPFVSPAILDFLFFRA